MDQLLTALNYHDHGWLIWGDPKVAGIALGLQGKYTKHPCFLYFQDSQADDQHLSDANDRQNEAWNLFSLLVSLALLLNQTQWKYRRPVPSAPFQSSVAASLVHKLLKVALEVAQKVSKSCSIVAISFEKLLLLKQVARNLLSYYSVSLRLLHTRIQCLITGRSGEHNGNSCPHPTKASRISKTFPFSSNLEISSLLSEIVL